MSWWDDNGIDVGGSTDTSAWGHPGAPVSNTMGAPVSNTTQAAPQLGAAPAPAANFDRTAFRDAWMSSGVNTVGGMQQWLKDNPQLAAGVTQGGSKGDKLTLPDGTMIDAVLAAGQGGGKGGPQWTGLNGGDGGSGGGGGGFQASSGFQAGGYGGGGGPAMPMPGAPTYTNFDGGPAFQSPSQSPGTFTPTSTYGESAPFQGTGNVPTPTQASYNNFQLPPGFVAPTAAEAGADQGYQFRQQQAAQALENSAASRGMSRTNNTWQGLQDQAGNLASQEYANVYGRRLGEAQMAYGNEFQANQANNQGNFNVTNANNSANLAAQQAQYGQAQNTYATNQAGQAQQYGQQANTYNQNLAGQNQQFNQALGGYQQNYANAFNANQANNSGNLANYQAQVNAALGQGTLNLGYQNSANSYGLGQAQLGQQASQFNTGQNNFLNTNAWNQNMDVARLGQPAAPNAQYYGQQQGDVYQNQGNAQGASQIAQGNAYANFAGNVNDVATSALRYYNGKPPTPGVMPGNN